MTRRPAIIGGFACLFTASILGCRVDLNGLTLPPSTPPPFGIAAGDAAQTSAVLWATPGAVGAVEFLCATDDEFLDVVASASALAAEPSQPVKIEITNLQPGQTYRYRVTDSASLVAEGTFRTSAPAGVHAGLRFGVSGDWRGELAPFPSIANVPAANLDLFVALGDTVYADAPSPAVPSGPARTLDEFRAKHAEAYDDRFGVNYWAAIRAGTSLLATIDDHEVVNDFAGGAHPQTDGRFDHTGDYINESPQYATGLQTFHEYNPIREEFYGDTDDPRTAGKRKLYRFRTFGQDAAIFLLDCRSFRDQGVPNIVGGVGNLGAFGAFVESAFQPGRTMLGAAQLADLKRDLLAAHQAGITWKFICVPEPMQNMGPFNAADRFEGYAAERTDLLRFIGENRIENVVFIAADIHCTLTNNIIYQLAPGRPQIQTGMFETTTGSVAYAPPFGPSVIFLAEDVAFAGPFVGLLYDITDRVGKDVILTNLINLLLALVGQDSLGLEGSQVHAELLEGRYVSMHTFGWSLFEIDPASQALTITTYGIDAYTAEDLNNDPASILARIPQIVSRFRVRP